MTKDQERAKALGELRQRWGIPLRAVAEAMGENVTTVRRRELLQRTRFAPYVLQTWERELARLIEDAKRALRAQVLLGQMRRDAYRISIKETVEVSGLSRRKLARLEQLDLDVIDAETVGAYMDALTEIIERKEKELCN